MAVDEKKLSKLIKNGIKLTDTFFDQLKIRVNQDFSNSKDLEEFLARTEKYTTGNVLVDSGYAYGMSQIVLSGLNTRNLRARQRELFLTTVDHTTTELIRDVGEETKYTIRELAKNGYQTGKYHPTQLAGDIESNIRDDYNQTLENKVKNRLFKKYGDSLTDTEMKQAVNDELDRIAKVRARTIARTEIKRSQTIADYVSSKDAGCTHFKISCMESACQLCVDNFKDKEFPIDETENLPPFHPNCRCIALFYAKDGYKSTPKTETTPTQPTTPTTTPKTTQNTPTPSRNQLEQTLNPSELKEYDYLTKQINKAEKWLKNDPLNKGFLKSDVQNQQNRLKQLQSQRDTFHKKALQTKTNTTTKPFKDLTREDYEHALTKSELQRYDTLKKQYDFQKQKNPNSPTLKLYEKELNQYSEKARNNPAPIKNIKQEVVSADDYTPNKSQFKKESPLTEDSMKTLNKWANKRLKNKREYAYDFDIKTGKLIGGERGGGSKSVVLPDKENIGSIHTHPEHGFAFPSLEDFATARAVKGEYHYAISKNEIWEIHAEENLGAMSTGAQMDVQNAFNRCFNEGYKELEGMVKSGKLAPDEIMSKGNKIIGDKLLQEFNKKEWHDKGFSVKRTYR